MLDVDAVKLKEENKILRAGMSTLSMKAKTQEKTIKALEDNIEKKVLEAVNQAVSKVESKYEKIIDDLKNKITKLEAKLNIDSTNSSLPPTKNSISKKITNLREKSGKSKGGQVGHARHILKPFADDEIDEIRRHSLTKCPCCSGELKHKNTVTSDIIDFEIATTRTRNEINQYYCKSCKKEVSSNSTLPRGVSYGSNINASSIILMNDANTPLNKVRKYYDGLTEGEIVLSEGYLAKLQAKTASKLDSFMNELKSVILKSKIVHWDDTVININASPGCLRFYGNEKLAYLVSHESKKKEGIKEDGILSLLGEDTTVMHDHVLYNYNPEFEFRNAECNAHILRYLKGVSDNIHDHSWEKEMGKLLLEANENRSGKESYIKEINQRYDDAISLGYQENNNLMDYHFYKGEELKLIKRLEKYKDAHLLFVKDFDVPFSNNTAERSFRISKSKIKISGLFQNINTARNYAKILSYMETCYRNGKNKYEAVKRLLDGNPYTVKELLDHSNS